jgi:hypothetical protein
MISIWTEEWKFWLIEVIIGISWWKYTHQVITDRFGHLANDSIWQNVQPELSKQDTKPCLVETVVSQNGFDFSERVSPDGPTPFEHVRKHPLQGPRTKNYFFFCCSIMEMVRHPFSNWDKFEFRVLSCHFMASHWSIKLNDFNGSMVQWKCTKILGVPYDSWSQYLIQVMCEIVSRICCPSRESYGSVGVFDCANQQ